MKKINLFYDWFSPDGALGNCVSVSRTVLDLNFVPIVHYYPQLLQQLRYNNIEFEYKSIADYDHGIMKNDLNLYVIEPLHYGEWYQNDPLDMISEQALFLLKSGLIKLVFFCPLEGFKIYGNLDFITPIINFAKKLDISLSDICVIWGDLNSSQNYKDKFPCKIISFEFFQASYQEQVYGRWFEKNSGQYDHNRKTEYIDQTDIDSTKIRPHKFLCLNGILRQHRIIFISELKRRNIFKFGKVSLLGRHNDDPKFTKNIRWVKLFFNNSETDKYNHAIKFIRNWKPIILDISLDDINEDDRQQDKNLYLDTYFSVVTETTTTNDILFMTEKIFKPIVNFHPFIAVGDKGLLKYLRNEGYHTFPQMFDESYDDEPNHTKRITMVLDEVERLSKLSPKQLLELYNKVWPSLVHNRKLFLSKSHKDKYLDLLGKIEEHK